jgi:hypothetical protein
MMLLSKGGLITPLNHEKESIIMNRIKISLSGFLLVFVLTGVAYAYSEESGNV